MMKLWIPPIILLSAFLFTEAATAQTIATKPFVEFVGFYSEINGTVLAASPTMHDDQAWSVVLPFQFEFNGVLYSMINMTSNGYLVFPSDHAFLYYMPPLNSQVNGYYENVISPWGDDLIGMGGAGYSLSYTVSGVAPTRVVTFQWKNWMTYYNIGDQLNFQVKLHETSNMIEFVYGAITNPSLATQSVNIGLASTYPGDIQNRVGPWVGSTASNNGATYKEYDATNMPPQGLTYRFGCYTPPGSVDISMADAQGNPAGNVTTPGMAFANYTVSFPPDSDYDVEITLSFFRIGDNSGLPSFTDAFTAYKPLGILSGTRALNLNLPPAYYRVEASFNVWNNCLMDEEVRDTTSALFIAAGTVLCEVWPGDVNNDMIVNYADRKDLNSYIFNANLSPLWLTGPARFRIEAGSNPLAYHAWQLQPSIPWTTPEGCYMDADGNGVIDNLDYLTIKMNWTRAHGYISPKPGERLSIESFEMDQNFPNPFNPKTTLDYSAPERSHVRLVVTDMLGRQVATLVDGTVEAGRYLAQFDAAQLSSGKYIARVEMTGIESGLTFSKAIVMALSK